MSTKTGIKKSKFQEHQESLLNKLKLAQLFQAINQFFANKSEEDGIRIKSPIIGTAYLAPEPGAKKFVEVGQKIKKGQTIMIVEAMKTMNHVPSPSDGTVKKVFVNDGQSVEFGQPLIILN